MRTANNFTQQIRNKSDFNCVTTGVTIAVQLSGNSGQLNNEVLLCQLLQNCDTPPP